MGLRLVPYLELTIHQFLAEIKKGLGTTVLLSSADWCDRFPPKPPCLSSFQSTCWSDWQFVIVLIIFNNTASWSLFQPWVFILFNCILSQPSITLPANLSLRSASQSTIKIKRAIFFTLIKFCSSAFFSFQDLAEVCQIMINVCLTVRISQNTNRTQLSSI